MGESVWVSHVSASRSPLGILYKVESHETQVSLIRLFPPSLLHFILFSLIFFMYTLAVSFNDNYYKLHKRKVTLICTLLLVTRRKQRWENGIGLCFKRENLWHEYLKWNSDLRTYRYSIYILMSLYIIHVTTMIVTVTANYRKYWSRDASQISLSEYYCISISLSSLILPLKYHILHISI